MKVKAVLTVVLIMCSVSAVSAQNLDYSHDMKLHSGETQKLDDYIISFSEDNQDYLEIKHEKKRTVEILRQIKSDNIYGAAPFNIPVEDHSLEIYVKNIQSDPQGLYLNTTVYSNRNIFSGSKLKSSAPEKMVSSREEDVVVPMELENTGATNQTFSLSANSTLPVVFSHTDFNITELDVPTKTSKSLDARVEIPERARKGLHNITFIAEGKTLSKENVTIEVKGEKKDRRLELDVEERYKVGEPGETITANMRITSRGEAEVNNVNVTAETPDSWSGSVRPSVVDNLRARYGNERIRVSIEVPEDVQPGDYFAEVNAFSDKTSIDEPKQIRIHIRGKSGLGKIGIGIMVFSLILMAFVYRRFQRR
ncbi:MAG: hypothetical protein H8Z69_01210 [Nanohaloarchaea archaeon]|nr:hypothetical protein [Candidatus Nanohaloarchaea archaeon]